MHLRQHLLVLPAAMLLVLICAGELSDAKQQQQQHRFKHQHQQRKKDHYKTDISGEQTAVEEEDGKFYKFGFEYRFHYDSQIASGYAPQVSAQHALSRFQALVYFERISESESVMRLGECAAGQLNAFGGPETSSARSGVAYDPAQLQPIDLFEADTRLASAELEKPIRFTHSPRGINTVFFEPDEPAWSRNIKKALLSMVQHQLGDDVVRPQQDPSEKALEGELVEQTGTIGGRVQKDNKQQQQWDQYQRWIQKWQRSYTVDELGIEGNCETSYSVSAVAPGMLNVTKSVNFARCSRLADIAYGMQADEEAKQRGKEQKWEQYPEQRQQDEMNEGKHSGSGEGDATLTTKWTKDKSASPMIARQVLDRSTTIRYVLTSKELEKRQYPTENVEGFYEFVPRTVEMVSQYTLKGSEAEQNQAMQTVAIAKMQFIGTRPKRPQNEQPQQKKPKEQGEMERELLLYNGEMEQQEKCFFMYGDDQTEREQCQRGAKAINNGEQRKSAGTRRLPLGAPFVLNFPTTEAKLARAEECVRRVAEAQRAQGGDAQSQDVKALSRAEYADEFVQILRFCTEQEIAQLQEKLSGDRIATQLFGDALAAAGTRNTLKVLAKRIEQGEFVPIKAAQIMKIFSRGDGLPAPSDAIADIVLALCKTQTVQQSRALKQTCWLSFGAIVGELQQLQRIQQASPVWTPLGHTERCPAHKMELYTKALVEQYTSLKDNVQNKQDMFDTVVALKAIGNAALGAVPDELEAIIKRRDQSSADEEDQQQQQQHKHNTFSWKEVHRQNAMEALRRIPASKVHQLLVPVIVSQRERPQTRIIALEVLFQSQFLPSPAVIDQIAFMLIDEHCPQVLSYAYSLLKTMSQSPAKRHQQNAEHIKTVLRMASIDDVELEKRIRLIPGGLSHFAQTKSMFDAQHGEGVLLQKSTTYSDLSSGLPAHAFFSLSSLFNGKMAEDKLRLTLCQSNLERIFSGAGAEQILREAEERVKKMEQEQDRQQQNGSQNNDIQQQQQSYLAAAKAQLRALWQKLSIKGRSDGNTDGDGSGAENGTYVVLSLRVNNIDTIAWEVHAQPTPESPVITLKQFLDVALGSISSEYGGSGGDQKDGQTKKGAIDASGILFWQERSARVPTSTGHELNIQQKSFLFGSIKAEAKQSGSSQISAEFHPSATYGRIQKMKVWSSPEHISGAKQIIAVDANMPLKYQFSAQPQQNQLKFSIRIPQTPIRLLSLHSLPTTFIGESDRRPISRSSAARLHFGERPRAVQNRQLPEAWAFDVRASDVAPNSLIGQIPVRVRGHLHRTQRGPMREWAKVLSSSENHFQVELVPEPGKTAHELAYSIGYELFQPSVNTPAGATFRPQIQKFLSRFVDSSSSSSSERKDEDFADQQKKRSSGSSSSSSSSSEESINDDTRKGHLKGQVGSMQSYLDKYGTPKAYTHRLRASIETVGGQQNKRAEFHMESVCDARRFTCSKHAQLRQIAVERNVELWSADCRVLSLAPEQVSRLEYLDFGTKHFKQWMARAELEWGAKGQPKQRVKLDIKGEPSSEMLRLAKLFAQQHSFYAAPVKFDVDQDTKQRALLPSTMGRPFVNRFKLSADWNLTPTSQNWCQRWLEAMKAHHFFNAESKLVLRKEEEKGAGNQLVQHQQQLKRLPQHGRMEIRIHIDPVTQKHANISIQTETQKTVFRQLQFNSAVCPSINLVATNFYSSVRGAYTVPQYIHQLAHPLRSRAECSVNTAKSLLRSFDGVQVRAPISKCWTILAKDCSAEGQSQYAVLAKTVPSGDVKQKMIKVIAPDTGIMLVKPDPKQPARLQVHIVKGCACLAVEADGEVTPCKCTELEIITSETPSADIPDGVAFSRTSDGQEVVTIEVPIIATAASKNADGQKQKLAPTGTLTVHFDGLNVKIQLNGREQREQQCGLCGNWNGDRSDDMAKPGGNQADSAKDFHRAYSLLEGEDEEEDCDSDAFYAKEFGGKRAKTGQKQDGDEQSSEEDEEEEQGLIAPKQLTSVIEYPHQVCFSMKPVAQCPPGTVQYRSEEEEGSGEEGAKDKPTSQNKLKQRKMVPFTCLERHSLEAKRLKEQARRGVALKLEEYPASFQEPIFVPERCIKLRA